MRYDVSCYWTFDGEQAEIDHSISQLPRIDKIVIHIIKENEQ